jgi:signal transduction histidine kinase
MEERRSIWRVGPESTWTTILPVAFIIVSLLSLVILPIVVENHTARMRREITRIAEPARRSANLIQVNLSAELDKVIAFQVTGQPQYRNEYERLVAQQDASRRILSRLASQLGPDIDSSLELLVTQTARWRDGVNSGEFLQRQLPSEVFLTRLYERHPAYERSLDAATELETAIQTGIEDRQQKIRDAERLSVWLTIILTLLALTSALLVAGLGRQMRLLAREAMRRRQEAEHEADDAKAARSAAEREERRAAFLASAGQELTASLAYEETIATLARLVVPNLAEACVIDIATDDAKLRRAVAVRRSGPIEGEAGRLIQETPEVIARIIQERDARLVGTSSHLFRYFGLSEVNESLLVVPLVSRGQTLGLIAASPYPEKPFTRDDVSLFSDLARHASLAIDNAWLYLDSQQAVHAREEVLAIVSHDLRNPLNAITLGTSLLKTSESLNDDDREQLEAIELSARRMNRLIADLLDVTRLEGGKQLPIEPEKVDVPSLFDEAYELFKAQAAAGSITLQIQVAEGTPPVHADRHRVMQVLSNLIGNSLKFTPPHGVIAVAATPRARFVLFTVRDTGPGIPPENLGDIFHPYWQAKRAERLGAGLGLPIAKGIVEAHGGEIWVESQPGEGTTFYFTLPNEQQASATDVTHAAESRARG